MNAFSFADQPPVSALGLVTMREAGIPRDRDSYRPTIDEFNDQRILGHRHALGPCLGQITH